jgi:hypothetical protein
MKTEKLERALALLMKTLEEEDPPPEKRRPESMFQGWAKARELHGKVAARSIASGELRVALSDELSELRPSVRKKLLAAAAATRGTLLLALARTPVFAKLEARVQIAMLDAVERTGSEPLVQTYLELLSRLVELDARVQRKLVVLYGEGQQLDALLRLPGFALLDVAQQADLLRWYRGPKLAREAAPMRRNRMAIAWSTARGDLTRFLGGAAVQKAAPELQAELLKDFLYGPSKRIHLLSALSMNGHAAVAFGDPSDPRSVSYGLRWSGTPRLHMPDPAIQSRWTKPALDAAVTYATVRYTVSRHDEVRLIAWIEAGFPIADDQRIEPPGVARKPAKVAEFVDALQQAVEWMTAGARLPAKEHFYTRGGRATTTSAKEQELDRLLKRVVGER